MLQKVDAQHALQSDWLSARTLRLRVIGLYHLAQLLPGNNLLHLIEKLLLTGLLPVFLKSRGFQAWLFHRFSSAGDQ
jgi:hypothetical protein